MLGPLCVGVAALRIERWAPGDGVPDLWDTLGRALCRAPRDARGRLAVADSKKLCKPLAQGPGRLAEAERSVLGFVRARSGGSPTSDAALFDALGVAPCDLAWYGGQPRPFPAHCDRAEAKIAANVLGKAMASAGVSCDLLRVTRTDEARFNGLIQNGQSKANTTLAAIAEHAPTILALIENAIDEYGEVHTRIVLDRQGGRTRYGAELSRAFGRPLATLAEATEASTYEFADLPNARVRVQAKAEEGHLPVALASMLAKLVREMTMERFNAYWSSRHPGVRPTAGYATDARRWLADMGPSLSAQERRTLVRLA